VTGTIEYVFCDRIDQVLQQALMPQAEQMTGMLDDSRVEGQNSTALTPNDR
jgi:hypothetical protein